MTGSQSLALKISALLWIIWGIVHVLGGIVTIGVDATTGFQGIAAAVNPDELAADYHPAVEAVLNQHGWNLLWVGAVTIIGAAFIWKQNTTAIWVTAMVGGLLDVGYFVFIDLGGYGTFFPGSSMTIVSGTAIVLSFWAWYASNKVDAGGSQNA
ncbi:MAG: hypothetical protein AAGA34_06925 [Pseudomonadota bacterium]